MKDTDLIRTLRGIAKHLPSVNHQENMAIKEAATRLAELTAPPTATLIENPGEIPETGTGWCETWLEDADGYITDVERCAWVGGNIIFEYSGAVWHDDYIETYNQLFEGMRLWIGAEPTKEQREGKPWQTTKATAPTA